MDALIVIVYGVIVFFVGFVNARGIYRPTEPFEWHTPETMIKVDMALRASGLSPDQRKLAIGFMRNRGIIFRESSKPNNVVPDFGG